MSPLEQLAQRCEAATGPDRELDRIIYYDVLGFCRHSNTERSGYQDDTGHDCLDCGADSWGNIGSKGQRLHDVVPSYTTSLDAAMSMWGDVMTKDNLTIIQDATIKCWAKGGLLFSHLARFQTAAALRARG